MNDEEKNKILKYWPTIIAPITGLIYLFGYLKGLNYLWKLGIMVLPTEVYSVPTLFVSGLTVFVAGVPALLIAFISGHLLANIKKFQRLGIANSLVIFFLIIYIFLYVGSIGDRYGLIFGPFSNYILTQLTNRSNFLTFSLGVTIDGIILFILTVLIKKFIQNRLQKYFFKFSLVLLTWFSLVLLSQIYTSDLIKPPAVYSLEPGIRGHIVTNFKLTNDSEQDTSYSEKRFSTSGILLNRNNSEYIIAVKNKGKYDYDDFSLFIIPVANVNYFYY